MNDTDWEERAKKTEEELAKAAALINAARDEAAISSVTCGQMRNELEHAHLERDHYKNKVERCREVLGAQTNESICEAAERVRDRCTELAEGTLKLLNERKVIMAVLGLSPIENQQTLLSTLTAVQAQLSHMTSVNESLTNKLQSVLVREAEMREALENALVICQCFADGQEASPGFMDNNENVIRIKDALAKVKALPA